MSTETQYYIDYEKSACIAKNEALKDTKLKYLQISCSDPIMNNMTNEDIEKHHKQTGDYDYNEVNFNIFINHHMLVEFNFDLFGIHVRYDLYRLNEDSPKEEFDMVNDVIYIVNTYFKDKLIEMINESFYVTLERDLLKLIIDHFKKEYKNTHVPLPY